MKKIWSLVLPPPPPPTLEMLPPSLLGIKPESTAPEADAFTPEPSDLLTKSWLKMQIFTYKRTLLIKEKYLTGAYSPEVQGVQRTPCHITGTHVINILTKIFVFSRL